LSSLNVAVILLPRRSGTSWLSLPQSRDCERWLVLLSRHQFKLRGNSFFGLAAASAVEGVPLSALGGFGTKLS
jgi:hypothetical protein